MSEESKVSEWDSFTPDELRTAARVARASGGHIMAGAADAWEYRADMIEWGVFIDG